MKIGFTVIFINHRKYVFAQLIKNLPKNEFDKCVLRYKGNLLVKKFNGLIQFLTMTFGQLTGRFSLRDLVNYLAAHHKKLYHLGINSVVNRSTLAEANENQDFLGRKRKCCQNPNLDRHLHVFDGGNCPKKD